MHPDGTVYRTTYLHERSRTEAIHDYRRPDGSVYLRTPAGPARGVDPGHGLDPDRRRWSAGAPVATAGRMAPALAADARRGCRARLRDQRQPVRAGPRHPDARPAFPRDAPDAQHAHRGRTPLGLAAVGALPTAAGVDPAPRRPGHVDPSPARGRAGEVRRDEQPLRRAQPGGPARSPGAACPSGPGHGSPWCRDSRTRNGSITPSVPSRSSSRRSRTRSWTSTATATCGCRCST